MALKVIGAGFGRTGTLSLKLALEMLGVGRCYHMIEVFHTPGAPQQWTDAIAGKSVDWEKVFDGFTATVDFPGCIFYREFAALYPQAKVILTERESEEWFASTQATIFNPARRAQPSPRPDMSEMVDKMLGRVFDGRIADRAHVIGVYERHNAAVRRDIAPERLLVFNPKEGWDPLCAFLGLPKPAAPFPRANTREGFEQMVAQVLADSGSAAGG
jgi:hypothetical protein